MQEDVGREKPDHTQLKGRRWGSKGWARAGPEHKVHLPDCPCSSDQPRMDALPCVLGPREAGRPLGHMRGWGRHKCPLLTGSKANLTSIQAAGLQPLPCRAQWVATVTPAAQHHELLGRDWADVTQVLPSSPWRTTVVTASLLILFPPMLTLSVIHLFILNILTKRQLCTKFQALAIQR